MRDVPDWMGKCEATVGVSDGVFLALFCLSEDRAWSWR